LPIVDKDEKITFFCYGKTVVNLLIFLSFLAIFFYSVAALSRFYRISGLLFLGGLAVSVHAVVLYQNIVAPAGLNLGIFTAASLMSWVIALLLLISLMREPVENLAVVLFPVAALTIGLDVYFHTELILSSDNHFGVTIHILVSIIAYSLLSLSALQALFLALQDYQLHHKHPGWVIQRLPPLQVMESLLFQMITIGFIFLTVSLISGAIFLDDIFAQHLVHKTILSIVAWGFFAVLLWGRWHSGWRGKKARRWTLSGFVFLMLAYFGSKMVLELILHR
jgi:ABC-type uncharacterized transport system permease subunit